MQENNKEASIAKPRLAKTIFCKIFMGERFRQRGRSIVSLEAIRDARSSAIHRLYSKKLRWVGAGVMSHWGFLVRCVISKPLGRVCSRNYFKIDETWQRS